MKTQKLIPLLDYVLEQTGKIKPGCDYTNDQILIRISKYAIFLSEPLKLSQFVPCDDEGNILSNPKTKDSYRQKEIDDYQKAKSDVLFEGFKTVTCNNEIAVRKEGNVTITISEMENLNIDFLAPHFGITLTEKAVKTING